MPQDYQSIEDLINASQGKISNEDSTLGKFAQKQQEIKAREIERLARRKARSLGVPYINLTGFPISPEALALLSEEQARELQAICFYYDGQNIRVASLDPENHNLNKVVSEISAKRHSQSRLYLISPNSFNYAFRLYKNLPKIKKIIKGVKIKEEDLKKFENEIKDYRSLNKKIKEVNISDVVTLILAAALKTNASDIHIESEEKKIVFRFRIDGVLHEAADINKDKWKLIISRMKLLANVKINVSDRSQDGRFTIFLRNKKIEVRASFLPTTYGESVVMRLLRPDQAKMPFAELGLSRQTMKKLEREIKKPNGLVLTTGPTGSGKTTTLYSILNQLNSPETKIITIEDPIEYKLEGISQSQITEKYTFAKALRSVVRQDPDIIMVGEIRDLDTAEIAVEASLTGHLVLSTLHTNDASGVIPRLIEMGVKPYFLAPSINAVLGQRLVRRLCPHCRVKHEMSKSETEQLKKIIAVISPSAGINIPQDFSSLYKAGPGCERCKGIGYKGRIGIYEIFTMSEKIKELASDNAPAFKILQAAIEEGMVTMLQDGVLKALQGITSLDEVYRVIGKFDYINYLYDIVISQTIGRGIKINKEELKQGKELAKDINNASEAIRKTSSNQMINIIIAAAVESNAGDIHIEPSEDKVKVRFRIDGILHNVASLSKEYYLPLLSKIKTLAGFPTNIKKAAWDGRFSILLVEERVDSRISIISGGYGETVVIRLLTAQAKALDMERLGMKPYTLSAVEESISKTKGIIITTGPTGSGKTTTLYSILNKLNSPDVKIITIEDPIEYHLAGAMQTQIDADKGYTFAAAMRSLLRQNPNIIMIGEIRDRETAEIAIEASMTGHLVLSTIHANSAAGAIFRFASLGVERQLLVNSLECSIGQRLARRICPKCKEQYIPDPKTLEEAKKILAGIKKNNHVNIPEELVFYRGKGCEYCNGLGYRGRIGIYETITINPDLQKVIQGNNVTDYEIEQAAFSRGALSMLQDGILKALEGETSIEEVFRVVK